MVSNWKEIKLDSLVDFTPKRTIKKGTLAPFVSMADITENSKYIPEFFEKEYKGGGSRFKNGDTLFARITPCLQNGKCSRVTGLKDDSIAHGSTEFIVMAAKNPELDSEFIYYLARTPHFRAYAESRMIGSTGRQRVAWQDLADYEFIVPNAPQRKLIGKILSKFDEKIELNRQMNETLEAMAQALFKSWFVDFDPVIDNALLAGKAIPEPLKERAELCQAQLDSGKAKTNSEINDLFPSEFEFTEELGWIPKGWKVSSLEDLANISSSKRIFAKEYLTEGIPFYRGKEISLLSKGEDVSSEIYISQDRFMELKDKFGVPKEGDILLTSVGTLGNAYLVNSEDEFYFKDGNLTWFKDYKTLIKGEYLYYWLKSREAKLAIDNITIGSTQQALTISSLNGIKIVKPNDSAIKIFNESIIPIIVKSVHLKKNRVTLAKLRDTLLPKLMSGELRIADTEKLAENI
ncbi:MAG TPA: restriction endonuclease subunit S [Psychrobacter pasteurii]|nr:restriction endonuclease subunit S [Psychrobacter pasteurii]